MRMACHTRVLRARGQINLKSDNYSSSNPKVFHNKLPTEWAYEICIIDAMILINTKPLRHIKTVEEYVTRYTKT